MQVQTLIKAVALESFTQEKVIGLSLQEIETMKSYEEKVFPSHAAPPPPPVILSYLMWG